MLGRPHHQYISSANRASGEPGSFSVEFSGFPANAAFDSVVLAAAAVPKSFYLYTGVNNSFVLLEGGAGKTVTLPVGNYTANALAAVVEEKLNEAGINAYNVNFSRRRGRFTFVVDVASGVALQFTAGAGRPLGFPAGTHEFPANELESPHVANTQPVDSAVISTNIVADHQGLLAAVSSRGNEFTKLVLQPADLLFQSKRLVSSFDRSGTFTVLDAVTMRPLDLNGVDWAMHLIFFRKDYSADLAVTDHMIETHQMG